MVGSSNFSISFPSQNLWSKYSLKGKIEVLEMEKSWHMSSENKNSVLKICTLHEKHDLPATPPLSLPLALNMIPVENMVSHKIVENYLKIYVMEDRTRTTESYYYLCMSRNPLKVQWIKYQKYGNRFYSSIFFSGFLANKGQLMSSVKVLLLIKQSRKWFNRSSDERYLFKSPTVPHI